MASSHQVWTVHLFSWAFAGNPVDGRRIPTKNQKFNDFPLQKKSPYQIYILLNQTVIPSPANKLFYAITQ